MNFVSIDLHKKDDGGLRRQRSGGWPSRLKTTLHTSPFMTVQVKDFGPCPRIPHSRRFISRRADDMFAVGATGAVTTSKFVAHSAEELAVLDYRIIERDAV
jgi:hypothetical protein